MGQLTPRHKLHITRNTDNMTLTPSAIKKALDDDRTASEIGEKLAAFLRLRRDSEHRDRWQTSYGSKTDKGLARALFYFLGNV